MASDVGHDRRPRSPSLETVAQAHLALVSAQQVARGRVLEALAPCVVVHLLGEDRHDLAVANGRVALPVVVTVHRRRSCSRSCCSCGWWWRQEGGKEEGTSSRGGGGGHGLLLVRLKCRGGVNTWGVPLKSCTWGIARL